MGKLTLEEKERQEKLAGQYTAKLRATAEKSLKTFTKEQKGLACGYEYNAEKDSPLIVKMINGLSDGTYKKPSEFFKANAKWLFNGWFLKRFADAFYWAVDNCTRWPFTRGWYRRPFRSQQYASYRDIIFTIIHDFHELNVIDADLEDILSGNLNEEMLAYRDKHRKFGSEYLIAYEIDRGNQAVIGWIKDVITGDSNADKITYEFLHGIFKSTNAELHQLAGKLLLAARLQEGLRQAICETCDNGTFDAFTAILQVIRENNLIRFSSVKRAAGVWTGLMAEETKDLERISGKTLELICRCLESKAFCDECLSSEDAVKIYIALWAYSCEEIFTGVLKITEYSSSGTHQQILASGYFAHNFLGDAIRNNLAKAVLEQHHDTLAIAAVYLPCFMANLRYERWTRKTACWEAYFSSRGEAEKFYQILMKLFGKIPGKAISFSPCIFPWNTEVLSKSDIIRRLCFIAAMLDDNAKIDEVCVLIPQIDIAHYGTRSGEIRLLLSAPETDIQMKMLVSEAADKEQQSRKEVFKILEDICLHAEHFRQLEDMLGYKAADIRSNILRILFRQTDEVLYESCKRLICDKKEEKRTAALDIIMQLAKLENKKPLFEKFAALTSIIPSPTTKEQILIAQIHLLPQTAEKQIYGYGLYREEDSYTPQTVSNYIAQCRGRLAEYFPNTKLLGKTKGLFSGIISAVKNTAPDYENALLKLDNLIEAHKTDEYKNDWGETSLLGNNGRLKMRYPDGTSGIPFRELWDDFYQKEIKTPQLLVRMKVNLCAEQGYNSTFCTVAAGIFGHDITQARKYKYVSKMSEILSSLTEQYVPADDWLALSCAVGDYIAGKVPDDALYFLKAPRYFTYIKNTYVNAGKLVQTEKTVELLISSAQIKYFLDKLNCPREKHLGDIFAVKWRLAERHGYFLMDKEQVNRYNHNIYHVPDAETVLRAAYYGVISKNFMYKYFFEIFDLQQALRALSGIAARVREQEQNLTSRFSSGYYYRREEDSVNRFLCVDRNHADMEDLTEENKKLLAFAAEVYEKATGVILEKELKRGDTPTEFSAAIPGLQRIYGVEYFSAILAALGKDTPERSTYAYFSAGTSKKQTLSHLLAVCVPDCTDDAQKLRERICTTDITEKRLVEAALYSPEWIDIIAAYLGWKGFKSCCYYFMAHMNESFDDRRKAVIAKYTPISVEDLNDGAFDITWFKEAYRQIGEPHFNIIYGAAKYISDGAKHARARKYADAVMGRMDITQAQTQITEKRNKDTLMAYPLIPLENDEDVFQRYLFLQEFLKGSKKFGAQRRASEAKAVEIAMQNLAVNAGFDDVIRLTLKMETQLFDEIKELLESQQIEDITLRLVIDGYGKVSVECEKAGKTCKSIPAKYKKDTCVIKLKETKKQLTEQYRRTRIMLERSMEDKTCFLASELDLLAKNPVVYPLIRDLVFISGEKFGFIEGMRLLSVTGEEMRLAPDSALRIAHPVDLYADGHWHGYQKNLFERKITQPFKQVFRELYVKTDEEMDLYHSLRYSGNQIQPKKTVACLKERRWVSDIEDGLQKIYYKENIVARIYALADWFSPADIEAPTLEWVEFSDRKTGEAIAIKNIPEIIFSEVMRDVDMAVSVAHAGSVDPETSHSTIEMRSAIIAFTLPLFRLTNVTLEKNHAFVKGSLADYSVHLGSGVIHVQGGPMLNVLPVHSQHRGKLFLPFADEDPKTAQILSEILLFAEDKKIKDPFILRQIS